MALSWPNCNSENPRYAARRSDAPNTAEVSTVVRMSKRESGQDSRTEINIHPTTKTRTMAAEKTGRWFVRE